MLWLLRRRFPKVITLPETDGKSTRPAFGPFKALIADEGRDSREYLREMLATYRRRIEIVGESDNPASTTEMIVRHSPDVLLLEYGLLQKVPAAGGLHDKPYSHTRAIIILQKPEKSQIINCFRSGAHGIVLKGSSRRIWWNPWKLTRPSLRIWMATALVGR